MTDVIRLRVNRYCPDCGVLMGEPHEDGCDVARCLENGRQRLCCDDYWIPNPDCDDYDSDEYYIPNPNHDCGKDIWTGIWPGELDAIRLNKFVRWGPPWIECPMDHPEARPDLNCLSRYTWDKDKRIWE